jgi:hypothetical protein
MVAFRDAKDSGRGAERALLGRDKAYWLLRDLDIPPLAYEALDR